MTDNVSFLRVLKSKINNKKFDEFNFRDLNNLDQTIKELENLRDLTAYQENTIETYVSEAFLLRKLADAAKDIFVYANKVAIGHPVETPIPWEHLNELGLRLKKVFPLDQ